MPPHSSVAPLQRRRSRHGHSVAQSLPIVLVAMVLALIPVIAATSPPDPAWIGGIYDAADGDEIVTLIGEQMGSNVVAVDAIGRPLRLPQAVSQLEPCTAQRLSKQPLTRGPPPSPCANVATPPLFCVASRQPALHPSTADCPAGRRNA